MRRLTAMFLGVLIALSVQLAFAGSASAYVINPSCTSRGTEIQPGGVLGVSQCLKNGIYTLNMQADGNLVLYKNNTACWATTWERSDRFGPQGSKMYFSTLTIGDYTESTITVHNYKTFPGYYSKTYADTKYPGVGRSYSASLNSSGQFWVGWDMHRSC